MRTQTFDVPPQEVRITFFLTRQIFAEDIFFRSSESSFDKEFKNIFFSLFFLNSQINRFIDLVELKYQK